MITKLEIIMISIGKSDISRDKSRESMSKSSNQDIYIKLDKIIEKLNEWKIETAKIIPAIPKSM